MFDDIRECIQMRAGFLDDYFIITDDMKEEVEAFFRSLELLGEACRDSTEFEARFAAEGYSDQFNNIYPRCTQKPVQAPAYDAEEEKDIQENTFHSVFRFFSRK